MSYIDENLLTDEQLIYRTKPHWIVFVTPLAWVIVTFIFEALFPTMKMLGGIPLSVAIFSWISALVIFTTTEYGVTDKRVLAKLGFIRRNSLEILLSKIESIRVDQSLLGRLLGYGIIIIAGTGGVKEVFYRIPKPLLFRKQVQEQISQLTTPRPVTASQPTVTFQ